MKNERQIKQFLQKVEHAKNQFIINKDGSLEAVVHTEFIIETYKVRIIFDKKEIIVITSLPFYLDEDNPAYYSVKEYIDSLAEKHIGFYISRNHYFCCAIKGSLDDFYRMENPYNFLFVGIDELNDHSNEILNALCCKQTIYTTMHI